MVFHKESVVFDKTCVALGNFVAWADRGFRQGSKVVVHCHQGLHRTALAVYLLLRHRNKSEDTAKRYMQMLRPNMWTEFTRERYRRRALMPSLKSLADRVYEDVLYIDALAEALNANHR